MRIFNSLSITYSVTRDPGYWLSKRQAALVSRRLQTVLELTQYQRAIIVDYLRGNDVDEALSQKFAPKDQESIKGFLTWYDAEYTYPKGKCTSVSYVVANLNTGSMCVFIHGGWKPEIIDVSELFKTTSTDSTEGAS